MIADGRELPDGTALAAEVAILGGGAAGISLARALDGAPFRVALIESGGFEFEAATQELYRGEIGRQAYAPLEAARLRFLGGSTNHWGGWCRPLDAIDFEAQAAHGLPGWPFGQEALQPFLPQALAFCELGAAGFDDPARWEGLAGAPVLPLGQGGVATGFFQFSPPTRFGVRHRAALAASRNVTVWLHLNAVDLRLDAARAGIGKVELARLDGARMTLAPRAVVLACGGIENARLLLHADGEVAGGLGNRSGLVGRHFMDHPILANTATLVVFDDAPLAPFYLAEQRYGTDRVRATLMPTDRLRRTAGLLGSLTTVDRLTARRRPGQAAETLAPAGTRAFALQEALVAELAALRPGGRADAGWHAYALGCGVEPVPDPDSRVTLTDARDALGLRRVRLDWRLTRATLESYLATLRRLGAQLLAAGAGVLRLHPELAEAWPGNAGWAHHHIGTLRMGADPGTSVVDATCRVHELRNLYVAGSAVFPQAGAANPTLTIVALALRLGAHLREQMR